MSGNYDDLVTKLRLQWIDTEDVLATQRAVIEVSPGGAFLELPRGRRGEKGDQGDPGAAAMFRYPVANSSQLPTNLDEFDQGAAFPNMETRELHIWTGQEWTSIPNFIGVAGQTGATPELVIGSVTMGGGPIVSVNQAESTDERFVLDFQLPQGPRGPLGPPGEKGDSAALVEAPDFDNTNPPRVGDAIVWNGTKWQPSQANIPLGPWTMGEANFVRQDVTTGESGQVRERLIGTLTIPGLPFDWRPIVVGGQLFFRTSPGLRYDVDVRLADAAAGIQIGSARGYVDQKLGDPSIIVPFSSQGMTPGSPNITVPANTTVSIYVVARKTIDGNVGSWHFSPTGSSMTVIAMPVVM